MPTEEESVVNIVQGMLSWTVEEYPIPWTMEMLDEKTASLKDAKGKLIASNVVALPAEAIMIMMNHSRKITKPRLGR